MGTPMSALAKLTAAAMAATPGERRVEYDYSPPRDDARVWGIYSGDICIVETDCGVYPPRKPDAEFIAAASPDVVLNLLASLSEMEAALKRAEKFASIASDWDSAFPEGFEMEPGEWRSPLEIRNEMECALTNHTRRFP